MGVICDLPPYSFVRDGKQLPRTTCIWCHVCECRPNQRTCQACHTEYVREQRAKTKRQFLSEYLTGQLSLGG